jgi:hypothetical protein
MPLWMCDEVGRERIRCYDIEGIIHDIEAVIVIIKMDDHEAILDMDHGFSRISKHATRRRPRDQ